MKANETFRIVFLGGDTMLGRAIQLTLPCQSLYEELISDSAPAEYYLRVAFHDELTSHEELRKIRQMNQNGSYLWGDLKNIRIPSAHCYVLNLETAICKTITNNDTPDKGIHYHFHQDNIGPVFRNIFGVRDSHSHLVVSLANNHILDFGRKAMDMEGYSSLLDFKDIFKPIGYGTNFYEAAKPAKVKLNDNSNLFIIAMATECSGVPSDWAATPSKSGIIWLPSLTSYNNSERAKKIVRNVIENMVEFSSNRDILVISLHWGPNWARYESTKEMEYQRIRQYFAHTIIDEMNVSIIYGHSSHHIRGLEIYKEKLIMYGCGDLINDYEGFCNPGEEIYNTIGGIFIVDIDSETKKFTSLEIIPTFMNKLQLKRYFPNCPRWDPLKKTMVVQNQNRIIDDLINKINFYSIRDSNNSLNYLKLRRSDEHETEESGGPVLKYP